jgi:hypothetical protein
VQYAYIAWSRSTLGGQQFIAELAPDRVRFAATPVPEPANWALMAVGLLATSLLPKRRAV